MTVTPHPPVRGSVPPDWSNTRPKKSPPQRIGWTRHFDSAHAASRVGPAPTSFYLGLHASAMENKHPSLQRVAVVSAGVEELGFGDTRIYFPLEV